MMVEVRELVWVEASSRVFDAAAYGMGLYRVKREEGGWTAFKYGDTFRADCSTLDEAKAAAQADYESRILSALLPSPSPAEAAAPEHLSPRPWRYVNTNGNPVKGMADWIEDAAGNIVVENVGHIDGPFIVTRVNGGAVSPVEARAAGDDERECWRANLQAHVAAERMVREAIETLFGPLASLESEDAVLLRGPEPHHSAEAIIAALQRLAALTKQTEA